MKGEIDVEFPIGRSRLLNSPTPIALKFTQHLLNCFIAAAAGFHMETVGRDAEIEGTFTPEWGHGFRVVPSL
jgi:hypothetical protein